jgi:flagellar biosynthesis component FlhA
MQLHFKKKKNAGKQKNFFFFFTGKTKEKKLQGNKQKYRALVNSFVTLPLPFFCLFPCIFVCLSICLPACLFVCCFSLALLIVPGKKTKKQTKNKGKTNKQTNKQTKKKKIKEKKSKQNVGNYMRERPIKVKGTKKTQKQLYFQLDSLRNSSMLLSIFSYILSSQDKKSKKQKK